MSLKTDAFINRVLWHVPVKGQHNVRYYGLYVPGGKAKRDLIREQLSEELGEAVRPKEKRERTCPVCGGVLFHYLSARREISYIKNTRPFVPLNRVVQQPVEADRVKLGRLPPKGLAGILWPSGRQLN